MSVLLLIALGVVIGVVLTVAVIVVKLIKGGPWTH